jgi:ubiquinone/menaquinone biosynthesis C-methylase UbiE
MIDLGCGDLALIAPLLRELPLGDYTGVDLAAVVLPLAQQALGDVPYPTRWQEGDLLQWALDDAKPNRDGATATPHTQTHTQPDILHSSFAIHHLSNDQKLKFLEGARRRINGGGIFICVDVFRKPGESLSNYSNRYATRIQNEWQTLDEEQRSHVVTHLRQFDIPADCEFIENAAIAAGWTWEWAWRGQHQAEALAVLTPA